MNKLGLKNLSHKLVVSCAISFVISLYLILHTYVQTFDVTGILGWTAVTKRGLNVFLVCQNVLSVLTARYVGWPATKTRC